MKFVRKLSFKFLLLMFLFSLSYIDVQAASVNDGIGTDIKVTSENDNSADVEVYIKNANYYAIDNMNYKIQITGEADLSGDLEKTGFSLDGNETKTIKTQIKLTKQQEKETESKTVEETKSVEEQKTDAVEKKDSIEYTEASIDNTDYDSNLQTELNGKEGITINTAKIDSKDDVKTGDNSSAWIYALIGNGALLVILFIAFKKKNKKLMSMLIAMVMITSAMLIPLSTVNAADNSNDSHMKVITETKNITINGTTVVITVTVEYPEQDEIHDNTMEDLKAKNGDSLDIVYNDNNEISFLNGSYTDYKVVNWETAMSSLQAMSSLLNVKDKEITLLPVTQKTTDIGDTYYTFQQQDGNTVLSQSFITVGADKDGNTLCLSSSINSSDLKDGQKDITITSDDAEKVVFDKLGMLIEKTDKKPTLDYLFSSSKMCWVVYGKKIKNETQAQSESQTEYMKVYVSVLNGAIYSIQSVSDIYDYRTEGGIYSNDVYFKNVQTEMMTFTDYQGKNVELPVAKNKDGKYYFIDTERKILCTDYNTVLAAQFLNVTGYTFESASDVSPIYVSVFENIRNIYDNYKKYGIESIDGNGLPLLLCLDFTEFGKPSENACFSGVEFGWGIFCFGGYPISSGLDVDAHEYTHGLKRNVTGVGILQNVTGSIEESYADILGNITEMLIDPENSDTQTWLIGEGTGKPIRCMADPYLYLQPKYAGGPYYVMTNGYDNQQTDYLNDQGGIHANNSILSYLCYQMGQEGISLKDNYDLWLDTFMVFNPNAGYKDVRGYLDYVATRKNKKEYISIINSLFEKANIEDVQNLVWDNIQPSEGYTKVVLHVENVPENIQWIGMVKQGDKMALIDKDKSGICSGILENGSYRLLFRYQESAYGPIKKRLFYPENIDGNNITLTGGIINITVDYNDTIPEEK